MSRLATIAGTATGNNKAKKRKDAVKALQATVRDTFHDLKMKYLPRTWLEIIAVKA